MTYTSDEAYGKMLEDVYRVYQIFKDFFGEEYVDLQDLPSKDAFDASFHNQVPDKATDKRAIKIMLERFKEERPTIYVYWPKVTVTNEYDKSIDIQELYAKIPITLGGNLPYESWGFYLDRAEYSHEQWEKGYMHSHCPGVLGVPGFVEPCLGTGPIKNTILELKTHNDDAEWMLFCQELAIYVTVESVAGGPYIRLETVGSNGQAEVPMHFSTSTTSPFDNNCKFFSLETVYGKHTVQNFIEYYLQNGHLKFDFKNGSFVVGMSYYGFMLDISNCFIDFFNKNLLQTEDSINALYRNDIISSYTVSNGRFYRKQGNRREAVPPNARILTFKGEDIYLKVHDRNDDSEEIKETLVIDSNLAQAILAHILKVINYRYKNKYGKQHNDTSTYYKNVRYL